MCYSGTCLWERRDGTCCKPRREICPWSPEAIDAECAREAEAEAAAAAANPDDIDEEDE